MSQQLRLRRLKPLLLASLLAAMVLAASTVIAPKAHANGAGNYEYDYGRWHTSINISSYVDNGHITWVVKPRCWANADPQPYAIFGVDYYLACTSFVLDSSGWVALDWQACSVTQYPNHFTNPACNVPLQTEYVSAQNWTYAIEITSGSILEDLGDNHYTQLDQPPGTMDVEATT